MRQEISKQLCHLSRTPVGNALFQPILQCVGPQINYYPYRWCTSDLPSLAELIDSADDELFNDILPNLHHVLNTWPSFVRMLYKDILISLLGLHLLIFFSSCYVIVDFAFCRGFINILLIN